LGTCSITRFVLKIFFELTLGWIGHIICIHRNQKEVVRDGSVVFMNWDEGRSLDELVVFGGGPGIA
jgi:hypothetical protein